MIRPTVPADTAGLVELARATGVFKPMELVALQEVLDDYHVPKRASDHRSATLDAEGKIAGLVYFAPASMTDRSWYIYWIMVGPQAQGHGYGSALLDYAEAEIRAAGGRLLLVETSSLPAYAPARALYQKHGFALACVVDDFYADGDGLVIFRKRLAD